MISVYLSELVGTAVMILLGGGVVANVVLNRSKGAGGGWIVIAMGWGFAVTVAIYVGSGLGGPAHFNPAVTISQAIVGNTPWSLVLGFIMMQFIGAMIGAALVWFAYIGHFKVTEDKVAQRDVFCTTPQINNFMANYVTEVIATAVLVLGILAIGKSAFGAGLSPIMVGFLIMSLGLSLGGPTGYAINPARDLGPRIMHHLLPIQGKGDSNWKYASVPVLGPCVGAIIGSSIYGVFYEPSLVAWVWLVLGVISVVGLIVHGQYCNKKYLGDQTESLM